MEIGSLSPSPPWGGPTFREGWGEGWIRSQPHIPNITTPNPPHHLKSANFPTLS
jgi:hypothetical protein